MTNRSLNLRSILKKRYLLLSLLLVAALASPVAWKLRTGDWWMHAAVVRELAAHPWNPSHPQVRSEAPHAFFSPYSLFIALAARVTSSDPTAVLTAMRGINLILFFLAFGWFNRIFFHPSANSSALSSFALLLMLLLWGSNPWDWSGFFHLKAFALSAAYPSTCAMAATLGAAAMEILRLRNGNPWLILPISILAAFVLIAHPTTAIVLIVLLLSLHPTLGKNDRRRSLLGLGAIFTLSFLGALAWPYYPFADLIGRQSAVFNPIASVLYENVLAQIWPCLAGVPLLAMRLRKDRTDPLVLCFIGLSAIYAYGAITKSWAYGRVLSFMMILLQLAIAAWLAEQEAGWKDSTRRAKLAVSAVAVLVFIQVFGLCWSVLRKDLPRVAAGPRDLSFLLSHVGSDEVVLSDLETSHKVPAFRGRVVAINYPLAWVDHEPRQQDVAAFFRETTGPAQRAAILGKYRVDFLLLSKSEPALSADLEASLRGLGPIAYRDDHFVLIRIPQERHP